MEEDTGKSTHVGGATGRIHGASHSLVDYNRAGIPLIEIVTKTIEVPPAKAAAVARAYVEPAARPAARARRLRRPDGPGLAALRRERVAEAVRYYGAGHPDRDQERELVPLGRARDHLRDHPAGRRTERRRQDPAGDPALARGHRHHHVGPGEVRRRRLPLLPRAGPGPGRAVARMGRGAPGDAARGAVACAASGCRRSGVSPTWRCATSSTAARSSSIVATIDLGVAAAAAKKWWLGELARFGQRVRHRPGRARRRPGRGRRGPEARRRRRPERQARPPGLRRPGQPARARRPRSSRSAAWRWSPTTPP